MSSNAFFTADETKWLQSTIPYYLLTKDRGPDRAAVLKAILSRFYEHFPNRHPRYFDFSSVDDKQKGNVIYGEDWKHMPERLRHWINANKTKASKLSEKQKQDPAIVPHLTQEQLSHELENEGFYSVNEGDLYSITDSELHKQLELTISRMDAYGASDFGSMLEAERDSATKGLTQDIYDVLQLLSAKTGGAFYLFGAWHNRESGYTYGHASSDNLKSLIEQESIAVESFERMAIEHVQQYIGRTLCTEVDAVPPTVISGLNGITKPLMPPSRETWQVDNRMLKIWMEATWQFQGALLPVPWKEIERDCREGRWERVERSRMPNGVDVLRCPDFMDEEESNVWCEHARKDCSNSEVASHIFQFRDVGQGKVDTQLRLTAHSDSPLRYGPEARLYIAHLLRKDGRSNPETLFPKLSDTPFLAFSEMEFQDVSDDLHADQKMLDLLQVLASYESLCPVQMQDKQWAAIAKAFPHLPLDPSPNVNRIELLKGLWLPPGYFNVAEFNVARSLSFTNLLDLVNDGRFVDSNTETLYGGPRGVIWLFLMLFKGRWTKSQLAEGNFPTGVSRTGGPYEISAMEQAALDALYDWLSARLGSSLKTLQAERERQKGGGVSHWPARFTRAPSPVPFTMLHRMMAANAEHYPTQSSKKTEVVVEMPGKKGKQRKVVQDDDSAPADEEPAATSSTRRSTRLLEKKPEGSKDTVEQDRESESAEGEQSNSKADWEDENTGSEDNSIDPPERENRIPRKGKGRQAAPKEASRAAQRSPPKPATGKRKKSVGNKDAPAAASSEGPRKTRRRR